jgi:predicted RNA-binding protein with PIN domain
VRSQAGSAVYKILTRGMTEQWIIDGYNLLRGEPFRQKEGRVVSHQTVFARLADFTVLHSSRLLFVLDGVGNDSEFESFCTNTFQIRYSQDVSADSYIERTLSKIEPKILTTVVTNDRAIVLMAQGMGARTMSIKAFMETLNTVKMTGEDILFKQKVRAHGFHRPFEKLLERKSPKPPC